MDKPTLNAQIQELVHKVLTYEDANPGYRFASTRISEDGKITLRFARNQTFDSSFDVVPVQLELFKRNP